MVFILIALAGNPCWVNGGPFPTIEDAEAILSGEMCDEYETDIHENEGDYDAQN